MRPQSNAGFERFTRCLAQHVRRTLEETVPERSTYTERDQDEQARAIQQLRLAMERGDQAAFLQACRYFQPALTRLATIIVPPTLESRVVVQAAWRAALRDADHAPPDSLLKVWLFRHLVDQARRLAPDGGLHLARFGQDEPASPAGPAVAAERFLPADAPEYPDYWADYPPIWEPGAEHEPLARTCIERAIAALPAEQQCIVTLRDRERWTAIEVAALLDMPEARQEESLHQARARLYAALEAEFETRRKPG